MFVVWHRALRIVPRLEHAEWLLTLPQLNTDFEAIWFDCQRLNDLELVGGVGLEQVKVLENDGNGLSWRKGGD